MLTFERHRDVDVYCAPARVTLRGRDYVLTLRVDARHSLIRVDAAKHPAPGWEAIDGSKEFTSVEDAKEYASRWLAAAEQQGTLSPRMEG